MAKRRTDTLFSSEDFVGITSVSALNIHRRGAPAQPVSLFLQACNHSEMLPVTGSPHLTFIGETVVWLLVLFGNQFWRKIRTFSCFILAIIHGQDLNLLAGPKLGRIFCAKNNVKIVS